MNESDLYQLLRGTADAAFVVGPDGLIRFWNSASEQLFGFPASSVLHQPCAAVLRGTDSVGAPVCGPDCSVLETTARFRLVPSFDLHARTARGDRWVNVTIIVARTYRGEKLAVHLARDIDQRMSIENVTRHFLVQIAGLSGEKIEDLLHPMPSPHGTLTSRERQITELLAAGRTTGAIGQELGISSATVRNHVRNILSKLAAHSRTEAVLRAIREKLI